MKTRSLLNERFQVSHFYTLKEWNDLHFQEKELMAGLHDEAEVYGAFCPAVQDSQLSTKVAYREAALVYLHLYRSTKLPHYLSGLQEDTLNQVISCLVLDQVLEIEYGGKFVSGVYATEALFGKSLSEENPVPDYLGILSRQGIEYALHFENADLHTLSNRLYTYNTWPWDSALKKEFTEFTDIRQFVFSGPDSNQASLLRKEWILINDPAKDYWLGWARQESPDEPAIQSNANTYKLYISPVIQDLPAVMAVVLPVLTASAAFSFKIGNGIQALLRPDKIVAYFNSKSSLLAATAEMKDKLNSFRVQGVPFTAQADATGLLSWGVDPPGNEVLESIEGGSWRCKITDQLAIGILQAKAENLEPGQAMSFIGSRLYAAGIDPFSWMPLN